MLKSLKLLAPVLFPSWRFFDTITASPRIEFTRLTPERKADGGWRTFRPRPQRLSHARILYRLFWNPAWNETLFLTSCAERLLEHPTDHSIAEIASRIAADLKSEEPAGGCCSFRFRLILVSRDGDALRREVAYVSPPQDMATG